MQKIKENLSDRNKAILYTLILLVLLVGIFLRLWKVGSIPISVFGDEIDVGLQAKSILTTGRDYYGQKFPVMIHSFSEYRFPLHIYLDIPFIKLFGLNEVGVRAPAVVLGLFAVLFIYLLTKELFGRKTALFASLFLMFSPWHFNFSRQANDAGVMFTFILLAVYLFLKGVKDYKYFLYSVVVFALSVYTYSVSALMSPLIFLLLIAIYFKNIFKYPKQKLAVAAITGFIILTPFVNETLKGNSTRRFSEINTTSDQTLANQVIAKRFWSNSSYARLLYNKYTVSYQNTFNNYLGAFSTDFLFIKGDPNMRQGIVGYGQMYHLDLVLLFVGIWYAFYLLKKDKGRNKQVSFVILWLLFSPIASSLTRDGGNHASRLILMLGPLIILSALGITKLLDNAKNMKGKLLLIIFSLLMLYDIFRFFHTYFVIWPNESARFWQSGFKETLTYTKEIEKDYDKLYLNNTYEPMLPRFLFYWDYDMKRFQEEFRSDVHIEGIDEGFDGFKLGEKYYFGDIKKPVENLARRGNLIVASGEKDITNPQIFENSSLKLLKVVVSPTDLPIFYIYTAN